MTSTEQRFGVCYRDRLSVFRSCDKACLCRGCSWPLCSECKGFAITECRLSQSAGEVRTLTKSSNRIVLILRESNLAREEIMPEYASTLETKGFRVVECGIEDFSEVRHRFNPDFLLIIEEDPVAAKAISGMVRKGIRGFSKIITIGCNGSCCSMDVLARSLGGEFYEVNRICPGRIADLFSEANQLTQTR